jgi:hypothetical protein
MSPVALFNHDFRPLPSFALSVCPHSYGCYELRDPERLIESADRALY